mmetsp:Transcript_17412/g.44236  ORF Transcript_17412/g.44236 Transcript_17412/m.44236 type:complete len:150 (-) Transcript_17412:94-543(-)
MRCGPGAYCFALCSASWPTPQFPDVANEPAVEVSSFPASQQSPLFSSARPSIRAQVLPPALSSLKVKRKIDQIFKEQEELQQRIAAHVGGLVGEALTPSFLAASPVSQELRLAASSAPYPTVAELVADSIRQEQAAFAELVQGPGGGAS